MNYIKHNSITNLIWGRADDILRDVYVRGKYRDVILPMVVIRRLDALLETTKKEVLDNIKAKKKELSDHIDEDLGGMSTEEMQSHLIKFDKLTAEIRKLEEAMREFRRVEEEGEIEILDKDLQKEIDDLIKELS